MQAFRTSTHESRVGMAGVAGVWEAQGSGGVLYVLEGMWEYTVEGTPPVTLKAGDVLFIPVGTIYSARNVGTGRAAELATYIVEQGKPLLTVVE